SEHQLGIAKNAVQEAYEELIARGVIENRTRLGHFVATRELQRPELSPVVPSSPVMFAAKLTRRTTQAGRNPINLGSVFIDEQLLARERIGQCFRAVLKEPGLVSESSPQGFAPLRTLIAKRLVKRGIPATADDVIVTTGSQQALDLVVRAWAC